MSLPDLMRRLEPIAIALAEQRCPECRLVGSVSILFDPETQLILGWICPRCGAIRDPQPPTTRAMAA